MEIKITDEFTIMVGNYGYTLKFKSLEPHEVVKGKNQGEMKHETYNKYYGTLYQALQGFMHHYIARHSNSVDEIVDNVDRVLKYVDKAMEEIDEKYKIVKVVQR